MKCNIFRVLTLILLSIVFFTGCVFRADLSPVDSTDSNMQLFEVENGSNVKTVSKQLESEGLIRNGKDFLRYAKKNNLTNIKAGKYHLSKSMSSQEILDNMVNGKIYLGEKIIVPEGFEIGQIAERLAKSGIVDKDKFLELASQPKLFEEQYSFLRGMTQKNLEKYLYVCVGGAFDGACSGMGESFQLRAATLFLSADTNAVCRQGHGKPHRQIVQHGHVWGAVPGVRRRCRGLQPKRRYRHSRFQRLARRGDGLGGYPDLRRSRCPCRRPLPRRRPQPFSRPPRPLHRQVASAGAAAP